MVKKFLKAILMGVQEVFEPIKLLLLMGVIPAIAALILKIFKININEEHVILFAFCILVSGILISFYIMHFIDAVKYMDEHLCDFSAAWKATK